jgi:hypothetical protein
MANLVRKKKVKASPKPVKAKSERKKLKLKLKSICSKACSSQAGGMCEICDKAGTQAHHMFSKKAFPYLEFNLDNLIWLCFFCHIRRIHQQGQYELARDILIKRLGTARFQSLKDMAYMKYTKPMKLTMKYLEDTIKELTVNLKS